MFKNAVYLFIEFIIQQASDKVEMPTFRSRLNISFEYSLISYSWISVNQLYSQIYLLFYYLHFKMFPTKISNSYSFNA
jgi:hypothetical protein